MPSDSTLAGAFKGYDIRALSPETVSSQFARRLGKAIAAHLKVKKVLVGRDMRTTSFALESALIEGLTTSGADVVRIGLCSTPMFYGLVDLAHEEFDLGIMITASHNPGKYNGFKIIRGDCQPVGMGSGLEEVREAFLASQEIASSHIGCVVDDATALDRYIDHILQVADLPANMPQMKIAIDAGNGMGGAVLPRLLARLPWLDVVPLYFDPDGSFPNHEANPLKVETLEHLRKIVVQEQCLLGAAFDGDADRIGFVDEQGVPIPGDLLTALFATILLRTRPGSLIHYDVRSSWAVPEVIREAGGKSEMCRVGHAYIKKLMKETGAFFAGEISMHFYFHDLRNCESGDLTMLLLLRFLAERSTPLSALVKPLHRYAKSDELNFEVRDAKAVMKTIEDQYAPKASLVLRIDGIRLEFHNEQVSARDWWFSVRASNTEPLLRLVVEARTQEQMQEHVAELSLLIQA